MWRLSYSIIPYIRMKFEQNGLGFHNIPQGVEVPWLTYQQFSTDPKKRLTAFAAKYPQCWRQTDDDEQGGLTVPPVDRGDITDYNTSKTNSSKKERRKGMNRSISISRKIALAYRKVCKPLCKELGLPQTAFDILMFLGNNPAYKTASEIVEIRRLKANLVSVTV